MSRSPRPFPPIGALSLLVVAALAGCSAPAAEPGAAEESLAPALDGGEAGRDAGGDRATAAAADVLVTALSLDRARVAPGERFHATLDLLSLVDAPREGTLSILVDGEPAAERSFLLPADDSLSVLVALALETPGDHVVSLSTDDARDLTAPVKVRVEFPARFAVERLDVLPARVDLGDVVLVSVAVANEGEHEGVADVELEIDGEPFASRTLRLGPGVSGESSASLRPESGGELQISARLTSGESVRSVMLTVREPLLVDARDRFDAYSICQNSVPYVIELRNDGTGSARETIVVTQVHDAQGLLVAEQSTPVGELRANLTHELTIPLDVDTRCQGETETSAYVVTARVIPRWGDSIELPPREFQA